MILSVKPSIEELIRQTTGKSFEEMTDEELINLVNSTRNCYQMLSGAAKARKAHRSRPSTTTATDWSSIELDQDDEEKGAVTDLNALELDFGDEELT